MATVIANGDELTLTSICGVVGFLETGQLWRTMKQNKRGAHCAAFSVRVCSYVFAPNSLCPAVPTTFQERRACPS